ncbi:MAG: HtaA domain-containing protein [Corynebacterium sp.]|nr:HtaA domain-containing protein [Corynebacterium sp.]
MRLIRQVTVASVLVGSLTGALCAHPASASEIDWGLRDSFVTYLSSLAAGTISTTGSIGFDQTTKLFTFVPGEVTAATATTAVISLPGTLHFTGHGGVLDSTVSTMRLEFSSPTQAAFVGDYRSNKFSGTHASDYTDKNVLTATDVTIVELTFDEPVPLATLAADMDAATATTYTATARLTDAGVPVFGAVYEAEGYRNFLPLTLIIGGTDPQVTPGTADYRHESSPTPNPPDTSGPDDTPEPQLSSPSDTAPSSSDVKATSEEIVRIVLGIISALAMLGMLATVIKHLAELGR